MAERLRAEIREKRFDEVKDTRVTVSIGVSVYAPADEDPMSVMQRADQIMAFASLIPGFGVV